MNKGKKILLGFFLGIGTIIIISAIFIGTNVFLSKSVDNTSLTSSLDDFISLYNVNEMSRDMPTNMTISEASCTIKDGTYEIVVTIENLSGSERSVELQLYYGEEFMKLRPNTNNPFERVIKDNGVYMESYGTLSYSVKGTVGSDTEAITKALSYVYLEIINGPRIGRLMLPLEIK